MSEAEIIDGKAFAYGPNGAAGAAAYKNSWFVVTGGIDPIL